VRPATRTGLDSLEQRAPAAILDRVVEKRGDHLILVAAVLEDEARDHEEMGHVGDVRPDSARIAVHLVRQRDGG
jgi:hypothetical protein